MSRARVVLAIVVSLLWMGGAPAAAQQGSVSVSYDALYRELDLNSHAGLHFDAAKSFGAAQVVGELGFNRFEDGTWTSSYQGGLRFQPQLVGAPVRPYGQFLLGVWHCCGATEFQIQPGAGVDFSVGAPFEVRVAYDFRTIFFDPSQNAHRVSIGIVKNF